MHGEKWQVPTICYISISNSRLIFLAIDGCRLKQMVAWSRASIIEDRTGVMGNARFMATSIFLQRVVFAGSPASLIKKLAQDGDGSAAKRPSPSRGGG